MADIGFLSAGDTLTSAARAIVTMPTTADSVVAAAVRFPDPDGAALYLFGRAPGAWSAASGAGNWLPASGVFARIERSDTADTFLMSVGHIVGAVETAVGSATIGYTNLSSLIFNVEFSVVGGALELRLWDSPAVRPAAPSVAGSTFYALAGITHVSLIPTVPVFVAVELTSFVVTSLTSGGGGGGSTSTIVATADQDQWRVALDVTVPTGSTAIEVQRSNDGGFTWSAVRGDQPGNGTYSAITGPARTVYDTEVPLDIPVRYRVRGITGAGPTGWSATSETVTITAPKCGYVIQVLATPATQVAASLLVDPGSSSDAPRGVFYRLGLGPYPVVVFGQRQGPVSSSGFQLLGRTDADTLQILAVVETDAVLVVRAAARLGWRHPYIAATTVTVNHLLPHNLGHSTITVAWVEVDNPVTQPVSTFGVTWAGVVATYPTWAAVAAAYPTWADLIGAVL